METLPFAPLTHGELNRRVDNQCSRIAWYTSACLAHGDTFTDADVAVLRADTATLRDLQSAASARCETRP